ncbi:MAG: hypothetical protein MZV63_52570 [Marinilabiliales bacterium]|nr:hypothetical protein [Marinilabiliales bacterium]
MEPLEGTKPDGQIVVDMMNRMGYRQEGYSADVIAEGDSRHRALLQGCEMG